MSVLRCLDCLNPLIQEPVTLCYSISVFLILFHNHLQEIRILEFKSFCVLELIKWSVCPSMFYPGIKGSGELPKTSNLWTIDARRRLKSLEVQVATSFTPSWDLLHEHHIHDHDKEGHRAVRKGKLTTQYTPRYTSCWSASREPLEKGGQVEKAKFISDITAVEVWQWPWVSGRTA